MTTLLHRAWVPEPSEQYVQELATRTAQSASGVLADRVESLVERNRAIHERDCFNLNPATNVMNPRAEALLASGIGSTRRCLPRASAQDRRLVIRETSMKWDLKRLKKSK